ncbi:MAG: heat-inducible transcription repressor HrcA [Armatimonadetes bacterium]|nr:heat-inducible transcription repressor HrcA [Armatimonadota bacterium]
MEDLQPRQRILLRAVILEYIDTAEPIASEQLVHRFDLGVSSATVRNEMAEMAHRGFLEQPHTSAGRIPSDLGYRYFVDRLIQSSAPSAENKQALRTVTADGGFLQSLVSETTAALSRLTHLLSAAAITKDASLRFRSAILSAIGPHQALLVLVLSNGSVESKMVECPAQLTLEQIGEANAELASMVVGKTMREGSKYRSSQKGPQQPYDKLMALVAGHVRSVAKERSKGAVVTHGEEFLFGQPEFTRDAQRLSSLLDDLKRSEALYDAVHSPDATGTVTIGKENRAEQMRELAVVRQTFSVGGHEVGSIAIIGPTRLPYEEHIPLVNFTATALTDALTKYFG